MSHKKVAEVDARTLHQMFVDLDIWRRIEEGSLTTSPLHPSPTTSYKSGTSRILLHFDKSGKHVASTHRIMNEKTGQVFHWDEKGIQAGDTWFERF